MPEPGQTRERGSQVTSDVTEPLDKMADVIEGLAAKNATMKDGAPEGGGGGGSRPLQQPRNASPPTRNTKTL